MLGDDVPIGVIAQLEDDMALTRQGPIRSSVSCGQSLDMSAAKDASG